MKRLLPLAAVVFLPALLPAQAAHPARHASSSAPGTLPHKHAPKPTSPNITAADLMTRLYIFADDSMMGREAGTLGNVKGTDYIAAEAKRIGLRPAGDGGTYFQTLPFKTRTVDSASTLAIGGSALRFGRDWVVSASESFAMEDAAVIHGGQIGDSASLISPDSTLQRQVLLTVSPKASPRAIRGAARLYPEAALVMVVAPAQSMAFYRRPSQFVDDPAAATRRTPPLVLLTADAASLLFRKSLDSLTKGADADSSLEIDVRVKVRPVPFPTRNVVAILPGSDAKLKGEYVAIGAHNDHVGANNRPVNTDSLRLFNHIVRPGGAEDAQKQGTTEQLAQFDTVYRAWQSAHAGAARLDSISNGADDDGSGSVSVLEIAERLASLKGKARPKRSILFVWHVGEEKGLLGSAYYTDHPTVPRDSIVAQLNLDMVGRGAAADVVGVTKDGALIHGGPNYLQLVGSRRLSTELGDLVERVNTQDKHGFVFDYSMDANGHPMNIYCRSDHYEYARYGIPITFFTTGGHSDYHQVTDEPEFIDYDHMARVANLVEDVALHAANLDHRIVVDQPKPDPRGACRQ
ncbi:MAG TPA: M28 family peptidase [Gemmatimonadaceae bacterium]|nr:M28 family peptidase [Gemmatimonadaceae bacterium]